MFTDSSVVPYGLLVMQAMDIYRVKTCPPPPFIPPPPPIGGGTIIGYVLGIDTVLPGHPQFDPDNAQPLAILGQRVCYGLVVRRSPSEIVVAIRGTDGFAEWVEDGDFPQIEYDPAVALPPGIPVPSVEQGFWGVYQSMQLAGPSGAPVGKLASALPSIVGPNDNVVVAGHSLGAALATYLTLDLARGPLATRVSGCFFASPRPGDTIFAKFFDQYVSNYVVYNYILDIVPRVPPDVLNYDTLPKVRVIKPDTAQANITVDIGCDHHIICYLAMLDYNATTAATTPVPAGEEDSATCIRGPQTGRVSLAQLLVDHIASVA